ncbi:SoxR reducing system RseC family protein [Cardiobacteriaceae bacterium TAE3-ERU3]|nr:SoxR reducing system RseC family protein [Cardiobacteriaceae bacterium TAE3-ERU3]
MAQKINVLIVSADALTVSVIPVDEQKNCARCEAGQGCGSMPWFRGLFRNRHALKLPQTTPPMAEGDSATLSIATDTLNKLSFFTYAIPLLSFITTLWLSQAISEGLQLMGALLAMVITFFISHRYSSSILHKKLYLSVDQASSPKIYPFGYSKRNNL